MNDQNNNQRLLGIDYGSKRIGVAMTNESGDMALPYSVILNSKEALAEILKICAENNVSEIIVGESKNFEGNDNRIMQEIKEFVHDVRNGGMKTTFHPEFMTSQQAEHIQGKNNMIDASAAAIILQSFLDTKKL